MPAKDTVNISLDDAPAFLKHLDAVKGIAEHRGVPVTGGRGKPADDVNVSRVVCYGMALAAGRERCGPSAADVARERERADAAEHREREALAEIARLKSTKALPTDAERLTRAMDKTDVTATALARALGYADKASVHNVKRGMALTGALLEWVVATEAPPGLRTKADGPGTRLDARMPLERFAFLKSYAIRRGCDETAALCEIIASTECAKPAPAARGGASERGSWRLTPEAEAKIAGLTTAWDVSRSEVAAGLLAAAEKATSPG